MSLLSFMVIPDKSVAAYSLLVDRNNSSINGGTGSPQEHAYSFFGACINHGGFSEDSLTTKFQAGEQENAKLTDHIPTRIADEFQASRELRWIIIRSQKFRKAIVGDISDGCPDLRV